MRIFFASGVNCKLYEEIDAIHFSLRGSLVTEVCAFYTFFLLLSGIALLLSQGRGGSFYSLAMSVKWTISDSRALLTGDDELLIRS